MLETQGDPLLWKLRAEQDAFFLSANTKIKRRSVLDGGVPNFQYFSNTNVYICIFLSYIWLGLDLNCRLVGANMAQMQTLSIRLPDEDFQWLLSAHPETGKTPSEKLRALVASSRQQDAGRADPEMCAESMKGLVQVLANSVVVWERRSMRHSELVGAALEIAPQLMAILASSSPINEAVKTGETKAKELETMLAQQCFRLLTRILRAAVTSTPEVYEKESIERYLPDIVEIMEIIAIRREKECKNGR